MLSIECVLLKTFNVPKYDDPWRSNELHELTRDKNSKLAKARKSGTTRDWEVARKARNHVNHLNEKARRSYMKEQLI